MSTRPVCERIYTSVSEAIFCVARFTEGRTLTAIAGRMGWTEKKLQDRTSGKQRFDAEWVEQLTLAAGNFAIVRTLCRRVGMLAIPIPSSTSKPADILHGIADISREYSEAMATLTECLDGSTQQERLDAIQQLTELLERGAALRAHLEMNAAGPRRVGATP